MRLNLIIHVYRGGAYWAEAWQSVLACLDYVENVCISFNQSELQEEDIAVVSGCASAKVRWIRQPRYMPAYEHGRAAYAWYSRLALQGHYLIFCHDDILLPDGMRELAALPDAADEAVFGSFRFFDSDGCRREINACQFTLDGGEPWPTTTFARFLFDNRCLISVTGIVLSVEAHTAMIPALFSLKHGCGSEFVFMINPCIRRVRQIRQPLVKIRLHPASDGAAANRFPFRTAHDYLFFCLRSFVLVEDAQTRISITRALLAAWRERPGYALLAALPALWTQVRVSRRPLALLPLLYFLAQMCAIRGYDFILRKTGLDLR